MKRKIVNRLLALVMALTMLVLTPAIALGEEADIGTPTDLQPVVAEAEPAAEPTEEPAAPVEPTGGEPDSDTPDVQEPTDGRSETLPNITARIKSNVDGLDYVGTGTEMVLTLTVEGNGDYAYTVQWQMSTDMGEHWEDIPNENENLLRVILGPEHNGVYWRAVVELVPHSAA